MGREIRRVPPNWQHPQERNKYSGRMEDVSMLDEHIDDAMKEWKENLEKARTEFANGAKEYDYCSSLEEWEENNSEPNPEYYRPWKNEEATWYQVWQTVSEGSPVTPPFETQGELVDYLVKKGEMYGYHAGKGYTKEQAETFVYGDGYVPSMILKNGVITMGIECALEMKKKA